MNISTESMSNLQLPRDYELYQSLIKLSPEGIWRCDLEQPISIDLPADEQIEAMFAHAVMAECNDSMAKMYGYEIGAEMEGKRLTDLYLPNNAENLELLSAFVQNNYRLVDLTSVERDRFGQIHHFSNSFIGVVIDGLLVSAWGTQRDITDEVNSREQLRQSEERLRMASQAGRLGIWDWNPKTDELYWSDRVKEMFGVPKDTVPTMDSYFANIHPDDADDLQRRIEHALNPDSQIPFVCSHRVILDGKVKWLRGYGQVFFDAERKPARMSGIVIDETTEKEAEAKAIQLHEVGASLANAITTQEIIDVISSFGVQQLEIESVEVHQNTGYAFASIGPTSGRFSSQTVDHVSQSKTPLFIGSTESFLVDTSPFKAFAVLPLIMNDSLIGMIHLGFPKTREFDEDDQRFFLTFADLCSQALERARLYETERSARREAEAANKAKSRFLANMSHEIRTPLGAILGFAELLQDPGISSTERAEYLKVILRNGQQLNKVINDILDISKIESDRFQVEYLDFDGIGLVRDVVNLLDLQAREKGVLIKTRTSPNFPRRICSDPTRLRQILMNLIGNAIKFTDRGEVEVKLSADFAPEADRCILHFEVSDSGVGIAAEHHERIFEPFVQADTSTTRQFGGTGLGLVIARSLAQALGGDLKLKASAPGVGSTFVFTIESRRQERDLLSLRTSSSQGMISNHPLLGLKILFVDDGVDNRLLVSRFLSSAGAQVETAQDGLHAVERALEDDFDLVLMDIQMPGMDGFSAVQRLRAQGYSRPVLALTAHAMKGDYEQSLRAGFDDHMVKPVDRSLLINTVLNHCRRNGKKSYKNNDIEPEDSRSYF